MLKAVKIRLYPNIEQSNYINNLLGCSRFVYNNILNYRINEYKTNNKSVSFGEQGKKLVQLKSEFEWLRDVHSKVLQQSIIDLNKAYNSFFKNGCGFPKFKSKHNNKQSCRFPSDAVSGVKGNRINIIKKLSDIHYKCSRRDEIFLNKYQKSIKSATLTKTRSGKYYLSILIESNINKTLPLTNNIIGIDLGIKDFAITSEGETFDNIKIKRNNKKKISKLHKQLSRKKRGSNNRNKCRIKLAKYYEKLNNIKEHYLHKISNHLLNENQVIVMEDLSVSNMIKNHKLAKSLQELSLFRFKQILRYKSNWYSRELVEIDKWFPSSKLCNKCNYKNTELTLKDRTWICPDCGESHDRDINAAINIRNEGIKILSNNKIGLSSPELTLQERITLVSSMNEEKNVI
ncbi:MAG: RNA-guided endonuclease TnpB family protein [Peptostreptococcales bacterium]